MASYPNHTALENNINGEQISLESDGLAIAAQVFSPIAAGKHPAIVVCHGFGSHKESHAEFGRAAAEYGFVTLALDFRGHGASEGCLDSRTINDIGCALDWLQQQPQVDAERLVVRGSSMGGYFCIHAAARREDVAAVVAICPATEQGLSQLMADARDPNTFYGRWKASGEGFPRMMGCDLSCWLDIADIHQAIGSVAPSPLLIIHCENDEVVPIASSEELLTEANEPKTFWRIPGGDHRFAQHDPEITRRTLDWLSQNI